MMYEAIRQYIARTDAIGFWVECDGNNMTATHKGGNVWELKCEYWNGKQKTFVVLGDKVVNHVENIVRDDPYAVYQLLEKPTRWNDYQIRNLMAELEHKMCQQNFGGFTLSADGVASFTVKHNPYAFVNWRINGKESSFYEVLQTTQKKLEENVYWSYTEL